MGRIKTDSGRIIYVMKDIIDKLGDDYELHIFPGSFLLYDLETHKINKCSANNSNHLELLRDTVFQKVKMYSFIVLSIIKIYTNIYGMPMLELIFLHQDQKM